MAEVSDILKIGKDKYLENNLEQKCGNPFTEWIPYDIIHFGVMSKMESKNMKFMVRSYITV